MISFLPRRYIADRQSQPRVPALQQPLQHVLLPHPLVLVGRPYRSLNLQFSFKVFTTFIYSIFAHESIFMIYPALKTQASFVFLPQKFCGNSAEEFR